jgi:hypothetical protein
MSRSVRASILGKAPWQNEFLPTAGLCGELWAFDEWLFRNAESLRDYSGGPPYGFLLQFESTSGSLGSVAGVISPSQDLAGREYPLAVASRVVLASDVAKHPEVAPIVLESHWNVALELLTDARLARPEENDRRLAHLTDEPATAGIVASELYAAWVQATSSMDLASLLGRSVDWLRAALQAIATRLSPAASQAVSAFRVPLGRAGGGALCFWLDVLRRAMPWSDHVPSFFWCHDDEGGEALILVGRAEDDTTLRALWQPTAASTQVCNLTLDDLAAFAVPPALVDSEGQGGAVDGNLLALLSSVRMRSPPCV